MRRLIVICCVLLMPMSARAQDDQASASQAKAEKESKSAPSDAQPGPKWVRTLSNVQVELTLTDQVGTQAPEKKTVSMIVSNGSWGKVRSAGSVRPPGDAPYGVELNVDARPFVYTEGPIQLELTLNYSPSSAGERDSIKPRPTGINQSLTVVLQSGKPLQISQAADPVSDRKVVVEVKATVLK